MSATVHPGREDVGAVLRACADDIDRERRLPDELLAALRATGLNRMAVPVELGGDAAPPARAAAVIEEIAAVNGSAGWCAAIGAGSNIFAGYVPRAGATEIWRDVDAPNASMFGPLGLVRGDGADMVLDGRWPFVSNCLHSSWIALGAFVDGDAAAGPRLFFVPADQVTVHDTWDVDGMRGTGSHDVSAEVVSVARERSCSFADRPWAEGPLWRIPLYNVLAPTLVSVLVGIARGSLSVIGDLVAQGHASARGSLAGDDLAMADLASAHADLDGARAALHGSMDEMWALASDGAEIALQTRARGLLRVQHAADVAQTVATTAHRLGGSAAAYRTHPLATALADINTSRQHILFSHHLRPVLGRALAGCDVSAPPFL